MMRLARLAPTLVLFACTSSAPTEPPSGAVARSLADAADEAHVPRDLLAAVAIEEGGLTLPAIRTIDPADHVPVAGALELRHGRLDTLGLGAKLVGATEDALRIDTDLATRAGAHVLAHLGEQYGAGSSFESWRPALEALSGMDDQNARDYASRVLAILRGGGVFAARGGETLQLATHLEIAVGETLPDTTARLVPAAPDFPGAIWFQTSCTNKCTIGRPLGQAAVNKIVIHDTEGGWDASVSTLQFDPNKSVHYIVDADGSRVGQFRPETDTTWHAGNYFYNETSVGIEHVGKASDPAGYSTGLYTKSRALVENIRTRWNVPLDRKHIVGHYQIPDGKSIPEDSPACADTLDSCETSSSYGGADHHRDPGYYWQWCQYMEKLGGSCTCNDAWDHWNCTTDKTEAVRCHAGVVEIAHCTDPCQVMAVGVDDVCNTSSSTGPDAGASAPDAGDGSGSNPDQDPGTHHGGGCSTGDAPGALLCLAIGLLLVRRRQ